MNERWAMALRGEYFQDVNGIVIDRNSPSGFKTCGISFNLDRKINNNVLFRIEARHLQNGTPLYARNSELVRGNTFLITSLALTFP
ncbi:MAG: outer membrane beta-barrel protein [Cyclobacteriaceae bacterium]|nr:outer membrane beta-barrel protein [Cyclobacteriaceae bacterium]